MDILDIFLDILLKPPQPLMGLFFDQTICNGLLELDDIPLECDIFERHFKIIHQGNLYCDINKQAIDGLLQQISEDNNKSHAILVMGDQHGAYA